MSKDYARYRGATKRKANHQKWRLSVFLLILAGFLIGGGGYYWHAHKSVFSRENLNNFVLSVKSIIKHRNHPVETAKLAKPTVTAAHVDQDEVHFDFYTQLPTMQVELPKVAESAPPPVIPNKPIEKITEPQDLTSQIDESIKTATQETDKTNIRPMGQYYLQVGVFKEQLGATQLRLSLLFAGIESEIVPVTEGQNTIYRVQQGPFTDVASAKITQQKLLKKGIESIVKKLA